MNFIDTLEQDKETTALDALGELAQKDSTEAKTIEEDDATEAWFALEQACKNGTFFDLTPIHFPATRKS